MRHTLLTEPPEALLTLPCGLINTQIPSITLSSTAPTKLLEHRGGPLAAETATEPWLPREDCAPMACESCR
ncbi:hypothetical protein OHT59_40465 [Streptomyces sp. NBC_00243]|uniref:hypothetical protein n=1 Tax=Streptomyces sp. NBC_00243 TaxID=2975688 RepID=UPI002DD830E6|nr:hypothetical protein [Streptomyces sp. NBC_00243]WRZ24348.1 hypothetical protein OHT59_40465 [Streptomyces sp. NBC_00243]